MSEAIKRMLGIDEKKYKTFCDMMAEIENQQNITIIPTDELSHLRARLSALEEFVKDSQDLCTAYLNYSQSQEGDERITARQSMERAYQRIALALSKLNAGKCETCDGTGEKK